MTKDNDATGRLAQVEQRDIDSFQALDRRRDEILAGDLPALEEILIHAAFCRGSMTVDRHHFFKKIRHELKSLDDAESEIIEQAIVDGSVPVLELARGIFAERHRFSDVARCDLYITCNPDAGEAAEAAARRLFHERQSSRYDLRFGLTLRKSTMLGLLGRQSDDLRQAQEYGLGNLMRHGIDVDAYQQISGMIELRKTEAAADAKKRKRDLFADLIVDPDVADALDDVGEDRAEIERRDPESALVVPAMPSSYTGAKAAIRKEFADIAGKKLPLVDRGAVDLHFRTLAARWPHARDVIDTILGDLAAREPVRFRPTCLVGEPGSGKTALARAIASQLSLPVDVYSMAGMADASLMGTSAQWHSARPSVPLQLIQRSGIANGLVIWDEIEKASPDRRNGNALEALLPLFEPSQARAVRDLALEVEVDLSWISHFATANSLDGIPDPIRDRMRIIRMPDPGWQHIGDLAPRIIEDIAKDRGLDPRWYPPLAEDELDVIRKAWPGGSLRKLRVAIEATLGARDAFLGRA